MTLQNDTASVGNGRQQAPDQFVSMQGSSPQTPQTTTAAFKFFAIAGLALLVTGCGYHLGSLADKSHRTIAVPVFQNKSVVPRLQAEVTNAVIKRFQADGSLRVVGLSEADLVLEGVVLEVQREPVRYQKINQDAVREYRLTLTASFTVRERLTGKTILETGNASGRTEYFVTTDMQSAEAQALPLAAENLARDIVARVVERW